MMRDNAFANFTFHRNVEGGDTGKRRAEHRNFLQLWFTHYIVRGGSVVAQPGKFANFVRLGSTHCKIWINCSSAR